MMKQKLFFFIWVLGGCLLASSQSAYSQVATFSGQSATEKILSGAGGTTTAPSITGAGFFYKSPKDPSKYYFITAYHVIQGMVSYHNLTISGQNLNYLGGESLLDIAYYEVENPSANLKTLKFSSTSPKVGDKVNAWGYPAGTTIYAGNIKSLKESTFSTVVWHPFLIRSTCKIIDACSGGPLLNEKGEVLGINVAVVADGSLALEGKIAQQTIEEMIADVHYHRANRIYLGLVFSEKVKGTVILESVIDNSPADNAGLGKEIGKTVQFLDGKKINSLFDVREALESVTAQCTSGGGCGDIKIQFDRNPKSNSILMKRLESPKDYNNIYGYLNTKYSIPDIAKILVINGQKYICSPLNCGIAFRIFTPFCLKFDFWDKKNSSIKTIKLPYPILFG